MTLLLRLIARLERGLGAFLGLITLLLVFAQFALVLMNAVFATGSIWLSEARLYLNALIFLGGAGYAMSHDAHVRVDLFYGSADRETRALVDFLGTLLFLIPFLFLVWWAGLPYVLDGIHNREGSTESGGIAFVYGLKATILLFAAMMSLEALAMLLRTAGVVFRRGARRS